MIYVDEYRQYKQGVYSAHMTADSIKELCLFALKIGLRTSWLQTPTTRPHFDIKARQKYNLAIALGAEKVSSKIIVEKAKTIKT